MQYSFSRISCFQHCPYQFKLRYVDEIKTLAPQEADNALIIGNAMHRGIETNSSKAVKWFFEQYYAISDAHINEAIKLEVLTKKVKKLGFGNPIFEYEINTSDFHGFVDMITHNSDGTVNVYDFKYSNNVDKYLESGQLHIYKYYLEKYCNMKVKSLGFIFIPKTMIRQKSNEEIYHFRKRLMKALEEIEVKLVKVYYDESRITEFKKTIAEIESTKDFSKNQSKLCGWCEYKLYCEEGMDYMLLPKNEKRTPKINTKPDLWLYGESYSGKTVFMDSFEDVLMINTDGNIDHIASPVLRIMDIIETEGRITKRKFAWEVFSEAVLELEKKENDFKTIVLDLVEDLYEHCRLYIYDKYNVEHEQDLGFGKGWDLVRTEFLSKIKRLKNCGYQIVYISKVSASEITKKSGDKITTIKPNINDKVANVLAGTVDLTARVIADEGERYLSFKTSPYIFGGSRYDFGTDKIPLNKDEFIRVLTDSQSSGDELREKYADVKTDDVIEKNDTQQEAEARHGRERKRRSI